MQPSRLLATWISEFLEKIALLKPHFIALHLQEVGGKTYEKSMEYVQEFIRLLCESPELENFNRIRVYLDEDYTSAEHFTVNIAGTQHSISYGKDIEKERKIEKLKNKNKRKILKHSMKDERNTQ